MIRWKTEDSSEYSIEVQPEDKECAIACIEDIDVQITALVKKPQEKILVYKGKVYILQVFLQ